MTDTIDDLVRRIDERGVHWMCHRTGMHTWYVSITDASGTIERTDESLVAVLEWAVSAAWLPVVPRQPYVGAYEIRRTESTTRRWHIYEGSHFQLAADTKKDAEARIEAAVARERAAVDEWQEKFANLVATGTPDVDFRWAA